MEGYSSFAPHFVDCLSITTVYIYRVRFHLDITYYYCYCWNVYVHGHSFQATGLGFVTLSISCSAIAHLHGTLLSTTYLLYIIPLLGNIVVNGCCLFHVFYIVYVHMYIYFHDTSYIIAPFVILFISLSQTIPHLLSSTSIPLFP